MPRLTVVTVTGWMLRVVSVTHRASGPTTHETTGGLSWLTKFSKADLSPIFAWLISSPER